MNTACQGRLRKKQSQHLGESHARVFHLDDRLAGGSKPGIGDDGRGGALFRLGKERFILRKGQVPRLGAVRRGKAGEVDAGIPLDLPVEMRGNFSNGKTHVPPL